MMSRMFHSRALGATLTVAACALLVSSASAAQEEETDARRLTSAISRLAPYNLDGTTPQALRDLAELESSSNLRVSATARYLRAAASVDLATYATLAEDAEAMRVLGELFGATPAALPAALAAACRSIDEGAFRRAIEGYAAVAACLGSERTPRCEAELRRIADSSTGAATAARLLLLGPPLQALEATRTAPPDEVAGALAAASGPLCHGAAGPLAAPCRDAGASDGDQTALATAVYARLVADIDALERAAAGEDPLAALTAERIREARERLGWLAMPLRLDASAFSRSRLPAATSPAASPPLALLIVNDQGASVAIAPTLIVRGEEASRLDEGLDLALPGRRVLEAPFDFRPVIRPVSEVEAALSELRERLDAAIAAQGAGGPRWLEQERERLGLIVDADMMMADVARFVQSAQRAGYRRFALFGRRADGRLAVISATTDSLEDGPSPRAVPRVSVGPRDIRFSQGPSVAAHFERRDPEVGRAVASLLDGRSPSLAVHGTQPWLTFGAVFPTIDAVMTATAPSVSHLVLLLPP